VTPRLWYPEPIEAGKSRKWWEPRKRSILAKGQSKEGGRRRKGARAAEGGSKADG
jgi:hypothetical protein